jgi:hypothetical protein
MGDELHVMVNYYARMGYGHHIQTYCAHLLKRPRDPLLLFWHVRPQADSEIIAAVCSQLVADFDTLPTSYFFPGHDIAIIYMCCPIDCIRTFCIGMKASSM